MRTEIVGRVFKVTAALLLALALAIAAFEYWKPSTKYWWRRLAESTLTKISSKTERPFGLKASKVAFRLRQAQASPATVRQLALAAERQRETALGAAAKIYLARSQGPAEEEALQLALEAFTLHPNELTAWQYSAYLRKAGQEVPKSVNEVLLRGADWDYSHLLHVGAVPDTISSAVLARRDEIEDPALIRLAEVAVESEKVYGHWSRPEVQAASLDSLRLTRDELAPIASQNRFGAFLGAFVGGFFKNVFNGIAQIFANPSPGDARLLLLRSGRRMLVTIDALKAFAEAGTTDQKILKAREAISALDHQIGDLESGAMVASLKLDMTSKQSAVLERQSSLLAHPERYWIDASLVLEAIGGKDPNEHFLYSSALHGTTP